MEPKTEDVVRSSASFPFQHGVDVLFTQAMIEIEKNEGERGKQWTKQRQNRKTHHTRNEWRKMKTKNDSRRRKILEKRNEQENQYKKYKKTYLTFHIIA